MHELIKSLCRFSWATSIFGVRQMASLFDGGGPGPIGTLRDGFQRVAEAAAAELRGPLRELFMAGMGLPAPDASPGSPASLDAMRDSTLSSLLAGGTASSPQGAEAQRRLIELEVPPLHSAGPERPVERGRLDTCSFVVLGEGLAAGMGDFSLSRDAQLTSFPALLAKQIGAEFRQPLFEPPGIGDIVGFAPWPVIVPSPLQSTVLDQMPADLPANLAVPGFTLSDALRTRPCQPLIHRRDGKQTAANLILGIHDMVRGCEDTLQTQLECAIRRKPTFAIVELGYGEALQAAVAGDVTCLPAKDRFGEDYRRVIRELKSAGAAVLVLSIPDPFDSAHFPDVETAARIVKLDPELMLELWELRPDDRLTVPGLNELAFQLYSASIGPSGGDGVRPLPPGCIVRGAVVCEIQAGLQEMNESVRRAAAAESAIVYDLCALFRRVRDRGIAIRNRTLSADYLGGFYSLNGYYPGATGNALIANEILDVLNHAFGAAFEPVNVAEVFATDPVACYKPAQGANWTKGDLTSPSPLPLPRSAPSAVSTPPTAPTWSAAVPQPATNRDFALQLPPGLEQVLPVNPEYSYFGDSISAQNCRTEQAIQWGSGGNLFFGGLAMVDSHLNGNIRLKFTPPVGEWTTFELWFEPGLSGADAVLSAPTFFRMPARQQVVVNAPGTVSTGRLNLRTGQIDPTAGSLNINVSFFNSALFALLAVNPQFPTDPLSFPGPYGSACVKFEQRGDGKLDLTFSGSTFVPLGAGTSFPLNFCGPSRQFASIPSAGTVLHPHLSFTTRETLPVKEVADPPDIPYNALQEFTLFTPVSSFGDKFTLIADPLGGPALGRSRLLGRAQIQFGPKSGHLVPVAISTTAAGGVLAPLARTPLAQLFPGRLTPGPEGFDSTLRFPFRSYSLNDLAVIDDPFDISVGAIDVRTGELLHPLLHRGFINQDLIFALLRVEPRTPTSSFAFRGPGKLVKRAGRAGVFEYFGQVHIPYPPGFYFPDPNLATAFPVTGGGSLDPYLWIWAIQDSDSADTVQEGKGDRLLSNRGELFSYRFRFPSDLTKQGAKFEYENHSQDGKFRMHALSWIGFGTSNTGTASCDVISFSCFGTWSKDGMEKVVQAAGQISTSQVVPFVGIQIAQAEISDADTRVASSVYPVPEPDLNAAVCVIGSPPNSGLPPR